ncbi:MAG: DUF89 family protein [Chloroflexi bacterium]|nr:DUF89 family protein [Chloroflexota bacterium]
MPRPAIKAVSARLQTQFDCVLCLARQAREAVALAAPDRQVREVALRAALRFLSGVEWDLSASALGQKLHRLFRDVAGNPDPYASVKEQFNRRAAELVPIWRRRFAKRFPPLEVAVRLAIVGNLLDVGAKTQLKDDDVPAAFGRALNTPLIGSVTELSNAIRRARHILYLADNAGEIVFDRWLLAKLPLGHFTLVVRGAPVLNDATLPDARWAGLAEFCEIISNGSDAPGTILHDCSPEFRERFEAADLILSKGQGNYETLAGENKHIFFLLKVKCAVIAEALGYPQGSLVPHHHKPPQGPLTVPSTIENQTAASE